MDPKFHKIGVSHAPHGTYGQVNVLVFAQDVIEKHKEDPVQKQIKEFINEKHSFPGMPKKYESFTESFSIRLVNSTIHKTVNRRVIRDDGMIETFTLNLKKSAHLH